MIPEAIEAEETLPVQHAVLAGTIEAREHAESISEWFSEEGTGVQAPRRTGEMHAAFWAMGGE